MPSDQHLVGQPRLDGPRPRARDNFDRGPSFSTLAGAVSQEFRLALSEGEGEAVADEDADVMAEPVGAPRPT